ncbi:hypothetical protein C8F04DRAFT_1067445 [Mycena alexandri]|uniref:F-box domain-containing protein n=1 Tax=Mycena alexandri TaxID=1745969 RepID=A0AAD6XCM1_9AGAR|nr:hypothetical protein C8F04DRAFT_1067445 [Mycena alexandri]
MSFTLNHENLPNEMWLEIFAHLDEGSYTTSYTPFQPLPGVESEVDVKSAYTTLVLVCRSWHDWAISFLYRNLRIPDSYSIWTHNHPEYGRWVRLPDQSNAATFSCSDQVRRAILPYSLTMSDSPVTLILGLCPNTEVLIRPQLSNFIVEFDTLCPQLPSLKRLEWWWNYGSSINSLLAVLSAAPNLEYLFVGTQGFQPINFIPGHTPDIHLPRLRTLRLRPALSPASTHLDQAISEWSLPALDTLVLDTQMGLAR